MMLRVLDTTFTDKTLENIQVVKFLERYLEKILIKLEIVVKKVVGNEEATDDVNLENTGKQHSET